MVRCVAVLSARDREQVPGLQRAWLSNDILQSAIAGAAERYLRCVPSPFGGEGFKSGRIFGIAQFWTNDLSQAIDRCKALSSPALAAGHPALQEAEISAAPYREHVLVAGAESAGGADAPKAFFFACRKPGMSIEAFQDHWLNVHGPLVPGTPGVARYVQCHPCPEAYRDLDVAFDSLAEITFAGEPGFRAFGEPSEPRTRQAADLPNLWDLTVRSPRFFLEDRFDSRAA